MVVNLVRSGRKQPQLFSASAGGQARRPLRGGWRGAWAAATLALGAPALGADGLALSAGAGDHTCRGEVAWVRETGRPGLRLGTWEVRLDWEANIGYWTPASSRAERRAIIDIGLTPVLRLAPGERGRFFVEAGIGAHLLSDTSPYRGRELGSAFQFGDLIGIGWRLGDRNGYEVALRIEHFSNAGIKHPNQGIEFAMLRLVRWLSAGPLA